MKKVIIGVIVILTVYFVYDYFWGGVKKEGMEQLVLYYGETCPHCEVVENFIQDERVGHKLGLVRKEVFKNEANKAEMVERAALCGIEAGKVGVPFLWNGKGCNIGDEGIINQLKKLMEE